MADKTAIAIAERRPVLAGRKASGHGVNIVPAEPAARLVLRAPVAARAALSRALGLTLPRKPKSSAGGNGRAALWLGPDEWLVIDEDMQADLPRLCAAVETPHSAVDVSHRNTAILVSGPNAATVLSAGCPQDLSDAAFPVGGCSRTVFGKAEIVLWRSEAEIFRVEVWRSFADYAFELLSEAARGVGV